MVELGTQIPGKQCSSLLADLGAEVIRVERPGTAATLTGEDLALNRNKRSITVDLRRPEGVEAVLRLSRTIDVFLEGNRPGTARKLGLAFEDVRRVNPRIVYCSSSSFGQDGPPATQPSFDIVTQARAGLLMLQAGSAEPGPPRLYLADIGGAMMAAVGILAGIAARDRTGEGLVVDVSMLDGLLWWFTGLLGPEALSGHELPVIDDNPGYTTYEAGDGRWLALGVFRPSSWATLCELLGHPEHSADQWAAPEKRTASLRTRPVAEWLELFGAHDVEAGPCNTLQEALRSEHARARRMVIEAKHPTAGRIEQVGLPIKLTGAMEGTVRPAPIPGQHTDTVLAEIGYTQAEIAVISARTGDDHRGSERGAEPDDPEKTA